MRNEPNVESSVPEHQTAKGTILRPGEVIPHFESLTTDGRRLEYEQLWQRRNLVLFALQPSLHDAARPDLGALEGRLSELQPDDTTLVVSDLGLERLPLGTLVMLTAGARSRTFRSSHPDMAAWPSIDDVLDWVEFIRMKCPECPP